MSHLTSLIPGYLVLAWTADGFASHRSRQLREPWSCGHSTCSVSTTWVVQPLLEMHLGRQVGHNSCVVAMSMQILELPLTPTCVARPRVFPVAIGENLTTTLLAFYPLQPLTGFRSTPIHLSFMMNSLPTGLVSAGLGWRGCWKEGAVPAFKGGGLLHPQRDFGALR